MKNVFPSALRPIGAPSLFLLIAMFFNFSGLCQMPCNTFETTSNEITVGAGHNCAGIDYIVADVSFNPEDSHPVAFCSTVRLNFTLFFQANGDYNHACSGDTFLVNLFLKRIPVASGNWEVVDVDPFLEFNIAPPPQSSLDYGISAAFLYQAVIQLPNLGHPQFSGTFCQEYTVLLKTNINAAIGGAGSNVSELAAVSLEYDVTNEFTNPLWNDGNLVFAQTVTDIIGDPNAPSGTTIWPPFLPSGSNNPVIQIYNKVRLTHQSLTLGPRTMLVMMDGAELVIEGGRTLTFEDFGLNYDPGLSTFPPTVRGCEEMWKSIEIQYGSLVMNGGIIQDGEEGVIVEASSVLDVDGATFHNNHISVQKEWGTGDTQKFKISNSTFEVTEKGLLPPMAGATNAQGIVVNHENGKPGVELNGNSYKNLLLAVNSQQSNMVSLNGNYEDIHGTGIYMGADNFNSLIQSGGTFSNTRTGIECRNIEILQSSGNVMDNVSYGYRLYNGRFRGFKIFDNTVSAHYFGITMFNWRPKNTRRMFDNNISILNGTHQVASGMRLAASGFINAIHIDDNIINCANGQQGIHLLDAGNVLMKGNTSPVPLQPVQYGTASCRMEANRTTLFATALAGLRSVAFLPVSMSPCPPCSGQAATPSTIPRPA